MASYDLILIGTRLDGEPTGGETEVARVRGNRVTGKLRDAVREVAQIGSTRIGIVGPVVPVTLDDPDLIAYSVSLNLGAIREADIRQRGPIVARTPDGDDIPFRYTPQEATSSDVILPPAEPEPVPLD